MLLPRFVKFLEILATAEADQMFENIVQWLFCIELLQKFFK